MDFAGADLLIDARAVLLDWLRGFLRTTNGGDLLCCCNGPFAVAEFYLPAFAT
jgi:hypothetical protein